jgi:hypothetical protein
MLKAKLFSLVIVGIFVSVPAHAWAWFGNSTKVDPTTQRLQATTAEQDQESLDLLDVETAKDFNAFEEDDHLLSFADYQLKTNTALLKAAKAAQDKIKKRVPTSDAQKALYASQIAALQPDVDAAQAIVNQWTARYNNIAADEQKLNSVTQTEKNYDQTKNDISDSSLTLKDKNLQRRIQNNTYTGMLNQADQLGDTKVASVYDAKAVADFKKYRETHAWNSPYANVSTVTVETSYTAANRPFLNTATNQFLLPNGFMLSGQVPKFIRTPASETVAVAAPQSELAAPPTKAPEASAKATVDCDKVFTDLAMLVMQKGNSKILSEMVQIAALKMAAVASNSSSQTLEEIARKQKDQFASIANDDFKKKLTALYFNSSDDSQIIIDKIKDGKESYFDKNLRVKYSNDSIRFGNSDASAFLLYLSETKQGGFTAADAAAVWAQGKLFSQRNYILGDEKSNLSNFSSQVYHLTHGITKKSGTEEDLDKNIQNEIQKQLVDVTGNDKGKALLSAIYSSGCIEQDKKPGEASASSCNLSSSDSTTIGSESLDKLKEKIAEMAGKSSMQGLVETYTLNKPTFNTDGSFSVDISAAPNSAVAPSGPAPASVPVAPAIPSAPKLQTVPSSVLLPGPKINTPSADTAVNG